MAEDPRIGSVLQDRYRILERLSAGAMGVVYRAERVGLGRVVAVKFLHSIFAGDARSTERFELEARTMSRLEHPNCVAVIDFGVSDAPFIVMEFVTGTTLRTVIDDGPVPPGRAVGLTRQICAGLAHAHEKGIIHRDVKPANIMLAQATGTGDHVRILDFGLAKLRDADASASSLVVGTPSYMSPEQASGKKVDGRTDVYAAGVVLFELLTGEKPFFSDQAFEVIRKHIEEPAPAVGHGVSAELEAVVARALAKSPEDRFQSPGEMAEALLDVPEAAGRASTSAPVRAATSAPPVRAATSAPPVRAARAATSAPPVAAAEMSAAAPAAPRARVAHAGGGGGGFIVVLLLLAGAFGGWWFLGKPGLGSTSKSSAAPPASAGDPIRALHDERRARPDDASISMRLADAYFAKKWYAESLAAYREAIEKDARLRTNKTLLRHVGAMLSDDAMREKARVVFLKDIGKDAVPYLKTLKKNKAAADLVKELEARK